MAVEYATTGMPRSSVRHRPINQDNNVHVVRTQRASRQAGTRTVQSAQPYYEEDEQYQTASTRQSAHVGRSVSRFQRYNTRDTKDDEVLSPHHRQPRLRVVPSTNSHEHAKGSKIWVLWLIVGALAAWLLLQLGIFVVGWGTDTLDTFHYGPTRTSLVSGVFGHNNDSIDRPTVVIAMNINGKLLLEEIPAGDLSKVKTYPTSFTLIGDNATKLPVTLSVSLGSDGHLPNVVVQVSGQGITFTLVNGGQDFALSQQTGG